MIRSSSVAKRTEWDRRGLREEIEKQRANEADFSLYEFSLAATAATAAAAAAAAAGCLHAANYDCKCAGVCWMEDIESWSSTSLEST